MAEVKKKVELDIESNIKELQGQTKELNKSINNILTQLNKTSKDSEKSYATSLKLLKNELDALDKQLENKKKQAEIDAKIAKKYEETIKQTEKLNNLTSNVTKVFNILRSGDIKGAINFGIDKSLKSKLDKIRSEADIKLGEIEKEKESKQTEAKEEAKTKLSTATSTATKRLSGAQARLSKYQEQLATAKSPEEVSRLTRNIKNNERIINETRSNLAGNVKKISEGFTKSMAASEAKAAAASKEVAAGAEAEAASAEAGASSAAAGAAVVLAVVGIIVTLVKKILDSYNRLIKDTLNISLSIKDNFNDILKTVGNITALYGGMATYSTSSSLITNASARETQMKYGLSEAQTYALTQTMGMMGMKTDDDLMYMNNEQVKLFRAFMQKYDAWYSELQSTGALQAIQEFQLDFAMFKQELAVDFMKWFAANKESLLGALKNIASFVMSLVEIGLKIAQWFGVSSANWNPADIQSNTKYDNGMLSSAMSDYTNNSINNSRTVNININQSNTATGVLSNQTAMEDFYRTTMERMVQEIVPELE